MPRFFMTERDGDTAFLSAEDAGHIARVLRMHPGDPLVLSDGQGNDCDCVLEYVDAQGAAAHILRRYRNQTEPDVEITLYQALPKGDKMEFIIQKAVELGASRVVPVLTRRCISRPDAASFSRKLIRYRKIAAEAAKQCGRGKIPEVGELLEWKTALEQMRQAALGIVFYEGGGARVRDLFEQGISDVALLIGSEGGFEESEIADCEAAGIHRATLGRRILRCETAPLAALTLVHSAAGEM